MTDIVSTGYDEISMEVLGEYPDLFLCLDYLMFKEETDPETGKTYTMDKVTQLLHGKYASMPKTRPGLYVRIEAWRRDGTLQKSNDLFMAPKIEEMRAAVGRAITSMPNLIDKLIDDVITGRAKSKTLEHVVWLYEEIVKPTMATQMEPGSQEKNWLQHKRTFDPTNIQED